MNKKETYAMLDNYYKIKNKISSRAIKQCNNTYDITKNVNNWLQENNLPYCLTFKKPVKDTNIKYICEMNNYSVWTDKIIFQKNKNIVYICLTKVPNDIPIVLSYITYNKNNATYTILLPKTLRKYQFIHNFTEQLALLPEWYFTFITTSTKTKNFYYRSSSNLINENVIQELQSFLTCPQHFVNYVNEFENDNCIHNFSDIKMHLSNFIINTKIKTLNEYLQLFANNFLKQELNQEQFQKLLARLDILTIIHKISSTTAKQWKFFDIIYGSNLSRIITFCFENDNYNTILDTNRDIEYNIELIREYNDKKQNELISKQQNKIKILDNQPFLSDYILKVPLNVKDLIDEGKQQHNCVGSYYNESIARGETKIIFIRKKDNLNKSYITCQLNQMGRVVQARTINNNFNNTVRKLQDKLSRITENFYQKNILR